MSYQSGIETVDDTVSDGQTASSGAKVKGKRAVGVIIPANVEGTNLNLQVSFDDGSTWHNVIDSGSEVIVKVIDEGFDVFPLADMEALEHVRLSSDTTQSGDSTFTWIFKP